MADPKPKKFRTTLELMRSPLKWVIIHVPFNVGETWGSRGQVKVRVSVNGEPFRTSLFPTRSGTHFMIVNKKMQKAAEVKVGMAAGFVMEPDREARTVNTPVEVDRALKQDRALLKFYNGLNHSTRNEICRWVSEPKSPESRTRRADQIAERLLETMEAELELPPLIRTALARNPIAYDGWQCMSSSHRRAHLMGIFYYRTPDGRARRLAKAMEAAVELMERKRTKTRD